MKFNPFRMQEVAVGREMVGHSPLEVVLNQPGSLWVTAEGYEALVGYGTVWDLQIDGEFSFRVDAPKGARAFVNNPPVAAFEPEGVIFTNHERGLDESGMLYEVKRALRAQKLEHAQLMHTIRAETAKVKAAHEAATAAAAVAAAPSEGEGGGDDASAS